MSSHKLNKLVGEYNKLRSKASQIEAKESPAEEAEESEEVQEMEEALGVEKHDKRGRKLEFKDSEGYHMKTMDNRKKDK
jgi:hypothetical protein